MIEDERPDVNARRDCEPETDQQGGPRYWAILPAPVRYDKNIPEGAKILYAEISSLTWDTGYCFASNEYFRKLYRCTVRTVQRYLKALEDGGYIHIENGDGGAGRRRIYSGMNPFAHNHDKNVMVHDGTATKLSRDHDKIVTQNNKDNNNTPHKAPQGAERAEVSTRNIMSIPDWKPERFQKFWEFYPPQPDGRKPNKARAAKAWDRIRPDDSTIDTMATALMRQKKSDQWTRGIGVPYASTWLNQRMWEDEYVLPAVPAPSGEEELPWL